MIKGKYTFKKKFKPLLDLVQICVPSAPYTKSLHPSKLHICHLCVPAAMSRERWSLSLAVWMKCVCYRKNPVWILFLVLCLHENLFLVLHLCKNPVWILFLGVCVCENPVQILLLVLWLCENPVWILFLVLCVCKWKSCMNPVLSSMAVWKSCVKPFLSSVCVWEWKNPVWILFLVLWLCENPVQIYESCA